MTNRFKDGFTHDEVVQIEGALRERLSALEKVLDDTHRLVRAIKPEDGANARHVRMLWTEVEDFHRDQHRLTNALLTELTRQAAPRTLESDLREDR